MRINQKGQVTDKPTKGMKNKINTLFTEKQLRQMDTDPIKKKPRPKKSRPHNDPYQYTLADYIDLPPE